jgi:hypothetical protein
MLENAAESHLSAACSVGTLFAYRNPNFLILERIAPDFL